MTPDALSQHVTPLMLVICRMAGLLVFTPLLANRSLPRQFRALLAVMLGVGVYAGLPTQGGLTLLPPAGLPDLLPLIVSETLIGAVIGFLAGLPIIALDMAGFLMGHQMGMGLARVYNPEMGTDSDVLGQILMYVGLATFVAVGGLEAAYLSLVSTFERVPIGAFAIDRAPVELIVGVLGSGFELAARVAAPVLAIIFMLLIAMGFVTKTMPQINVLSVGFTIKILAGLAMLAASLGAMHGAAAEEIERVLQVVMEWARAPA